MSALRLGLMTGGLLGGVFGLVELARLGAGRWRRRTVARLRDGSTIAMTARGLVEYAAVGSGPPVLMLHATPGGSDQGRMLADVAGARGFRLVAPSRPGYLRTPIEIGRSPAEQAAAAAALLDALHIPKVAAVGVSGGGPSAIQFALRYPERLSRLVLWQAVIRRTPMKPATLRMLTRGFMASDAGAWLMLNGIKAVPRLLPLPAELRSDRAARARMLALLESFFPLDLRREGILNDARQSAALEDLPVHQISAPTLLVHGTADTDQPYAQSAAATRTIPNARLITIEGGTHESTFVDPRAVGAIADFLADDDFSEENDGRRKSAAGGDSVGRVSGGRVRRREPAPDAHQPGARLRR